MRVLLVPLLAALACSPSRQWPDQAPNVNTLKLTENGFEASKVLTEVVTVEKTRLVFPASAAEEVRAKWPAGKSVVGGPSSAAGTTNPLGFIRKVKEVRVEGDQVIVETEPTTIDQIFDGELKLTMNASEMTAPPVPEGVDLDKYLPAFPSGPATPYPDDLDAVGFTTQPLDSTEAVTLRPVGMKRQPLDLSTDRITVPTVPIAIPVGLDRPIIFTKANGSPATARMQYRGRFALNPSLSLTPRLRLEVDTKNCPFCALESFLFSVGGSVSAGLALDADVTIAPHPDDARTLTPADLESLDEAVGQQPVRFELPEVLIGRENVKKVGTIYGVPVLLKTGVYGECQFKLRGRYRGDLSMTLNNPNFVVGVRYQDSGPKKDRWAPVSPDPFRVTGTGRVVTANGEIETDCSLVLKTTLTTADLAGPYAGLRNGVVGGVKFADVTCPVNPPAGVRKTGTATPFIKAYTSVEVGAEVTLLKIVSFGVGPYALGKQLYREGPAEQVPDELVPAFFKATFPGQPLFAKKWLPLWEGTAATFPRGGNCPSSCTNGRKDPNEADLDCGGTCGATCGRGTTCTRGEDCRSGICSAGTCRGGLSDDSIINQGETDVDCGGPTNPIRCGNGSLCTANSDCSPGFCGKAVNGVRRCTENLCLDGVRSGSESDIDCGSAPGCSSLCTLGQRCVTQGDCTTGACSVAGVCVSDTCVDGIRNGTEADIDCGGSCSRKCAIDDACQPSRESDCASGICSSNTLRCVADRCEDGRTNRDETDADCGGTTCSRRCGLTARCLVSTDCTTGNVCNVRTGTCSPPGCDDGIKNGAESAIDCGGPTCLKCAVSKSCTSNSDCVTNTCTGGRCVAGPCENGVKDATEADVDCGGSCGRPCATGRACLGPSDCASNLCVASVCSSDACRDLTRNGAETGVDCGGATCSARCAVGVGCNVNGDCASGLCNLTTRLCVATTCSDGVLTAASESDVDCGGSCATTNACAVNKRCTTSTDCASGICNATTLRCVPSACFNGVRDGSETDVDCGGACEPKCAFNSLCTVNADCQSGVCTAGGRCAADQCSNGRFDGNETDLDCGGTCSTKCAVSRGCLTNTDCVNPQGMVGVPGFCSLATRTCVASSCNTGVQDGNETGIDCGGSCGTCGLGLGCNANTDCTSGICNLTTRVCVATQCQDGIRNGTETDIDCGGSTCGGCATNRACVRPWDCASGYCGSANLCIPAYPRSCDVVFALGNTTDGMYVIDPDGPPRRTITSVDQGDNKPLLTFCRMVTTGTTEERGGWTPLYFVNSQGSMVPPHDILYRTTRNGGSINETCSPSTACPVAGDVCLNEQGNACTGSPLICRCVGPSLWSSNGPAIPTNPAFLSVDTGSNTLQQQTISYASATSATLGSGYGGNRGVGYPDAYRWTAYRNGNLAFDAVIGGPINTSWTANGGLIFERFDYNWCSGPPGYTQFAGVETMPRSAPFNDLDITGLRTVEGSCRRFGRNTMRQFGLSTSDTLASRGLQIVSVARVLPGQVDGLTPIGTSHIGMWIAHYGTTNSTYRFPANPIMTTQVSIGFCNGMSSTSASTRETPCNPYRHPSRDGNNNLVSFAWGTGELTGDTSRGSEFGTGVPGLVFVLWTK